MQPLVIKQNRWFQRPIVWIFASLLASVALLVLPHTQRFYNAWAGARKVQRAATAFAQGDYETALHKATAALAMDSESVEALRVLAKTSEATGSPQALDLRRQIAAINPSDPENQLGLAEASLQSGSIQTAAEALESVPTVNQATLRYREVAAGIAWAQSNAAEFQRPAKDASQAPPVDDRYRLKLATLRLTAKSPELRAGALATLDQLKAKPAMASAALRALLRDSFDHGEKDRAQEFADALASLPGASIGDKLSRLSVLYALLNASEQSPVTAFRVSRDQFYLRLAELQKEAAAQSDGVAQVVAWMNAHHLALEVPEWIDSLRADVASTPEVSVALAEACALASDWEGLKERLIGASWKHLDPLRLAYLSRACERLQDEEGANAAWKSALEAAATTQESSELLLGAIEKWGWKERTEEVLWKLTAQASCPRWAADALWNLASAKGDTAGLFKASKLLLHAEPTSVSARNNFARLALICEREEAGAYPIAEALYQENATDAKVVSTYALSLFRQNRANEAVRILSQLPAHQLEDPTIAFYHGLFLMAAGQPDEAESYLELANEAALFPEMESVRRMLTSVFEAKRFDRQRKREECHAAWKAAIATAGTRPDNLEMLAKAAIKWGWKDKASEVLSELAGKSASSQTVPPSPPASAVR